MNDEVNLLPDRDLLERFRASLVAAGYSEQGLGRLLGGPIRLSFQGLVEVSRRRLEGHAPDKTLFRLFWLGVPVSRRQAEVALGTTEPDELAAAGIVSVEGDSVRPLVGISHHAGLFFAHDLGRLVSTRRADFVTGVNPSSCLMDWLTIRRDVANACDLGTGCGVQALLAAGHAGHVTALDINPRAVAYTVFNAALNGIDNVDALQGSWFGPVGDRRFELVVANLPFVISPDTAFDYRDSGLPGDTASTMVLSDVAERVEEGGFAHVFCNWIVPSGGDWRAPLEACVEGRACDALLVLHGRHDPLSYAARWNHPLDEEDFPRFAATVERWLAYYRQEGIEEIGDGLVVLRRRSARRNYVRALEVSGAPARPAGSHLVRLFQGYDFVRSLPEQAAVLDLPVALADGATLDQRFGSIAGRLAAGAIRIGLRDGAGLSVSVDPRVGQVLARCDGRQPLRAFVAAVAEEGSVSSEQLGSEVAAEARRLIGLGFLVASTLSA